MSARADRTIHGVSLSTRHHSRVAAVAILALIAQLLLPILHAQSLAQRSGTPLLYAYCGEHPALLVQQLRKQLAPADLQQAHRSDLGTLSCSLCASLHGSTLAGPPGLMPLLHGLASLPDAPAAVIVQALVRLVVLPPMRAPPVLG